MADRFMGVETEYAFSAQSSSLGALDQQEFLNRLIEVARRRLVHLPGAAGGLYLENGSRFYVDYGNHPEVATPECTNPWDVVRYILAGERILARLAEDLEGQFPYAQLMLFKSNVDYAGAWTTWGCHESYSHAADPGSLSDQVVPHLVTRIIYTGAGGFDSTCRGLSFTLSPRVFHLANVVSNNSTSDRGIFHTKDESLSRPGLHRLHIICGESVCSETAMWLKIATTALVVAMAEAGIGPGRGLALRSPVDAMRRIALDTSCSKSIDLVDGRRLSAIEIQYQYLTMAERNLGRSFMPSWAEEACQRWREALNILLEAPESVSTRLDWAIKLALYRNHAERRGLAWDSLADWTRILTGLQQALDMTDQYAHPLNTEFVLGLSGHAAKTVEILKPFMIERGLSWSDLDKVIAVKKELFEVDVKFGQLGAGGVFSNLARAGVLAHSVAGVERIDEAISQPPEIGRASLRGHAIKRFAGRAGDYQCDWQGVFDLKRRRVLDLSEPFEQVERWLDFEHAHASAALPFVEMFFRTTSVEHNTLG